MGYMFRLLVSHLQALKEYRTNYKDSQVHCGIPNANKISYCNNMESYYVLIIGTKSI